MKQSYDAVIIGGGFYGVSIALQLRKYLKNVAVIEAADDLFTRATYNNQARIHNGYHYPRSPLTALRSHANFDRFLNDYPQAVDQSFRKLYAIASNNSKVTARQFHQFMKNIGAPIRSASEESLRFFNPDLIEAVFDVQEVAFDAAKLKQQLKSQLHHHQVDVFYSTTVTHVEKKADRLQVHLNNKKKISAQYVFNCTYARLNFFLREIGLPTLPLKYELTEMALVSAPPELKQLGITVMDGPFFSLMPFPHRQLHSLSHVRYTPHTQWSDQDHSIDPYSVLKTPPPSQFIFMLKDAQRYCPAIADSVFHESLFEVKTVLLANEDDDGRPILFRQNYGDLENFFVVLGGKIDNIYDIFEKIDQVFGN